MPKSPCSIASAPYPNRLGSPTDSREEAFFGDRSTPQLPRTTQDRVEQGCGDWIRPIASRNGEHPQYGEEGARGPREETEGAISLMTPTTAKAVADAAGFTQDTTDG